MHTHLIIEPQKLSDWIKWVVETRKDEFLEGVQKLPHELQELMERLDYQHGDILFLNDGLTPFWIEPYVLGRLTNRVNLMTISFTTVDFDLGFLNSLITTGNYRKISKDEYLHWLGYK